MTGRRRGQANLIALTVALLALTAAVGGALAVADGALAAADRDPLDRRAAAGLADRLLAPSANTTSRAGVLRNESIRSLDGAAIDGLAPLVAGKPVRIALGDEVLVDRGTPERGTTVRRIARVSRPTRETRRLDVAVDRNLEVPTGVDRVDLEIRPGAGTNVTTMRANGRVALHVPAGIVGPATVVVDRTRPTRLDATVDGNATGTIRVAYTRPQTTAAVLSVTVDA